MPKITPISLISFAGSPSGEPAKGNRSKSGHLAHLKVCPSECSMSILPSDCLAVVVWHATWNDSCGRVDPDHHDQHECSVGMVEGERDCDETDCQRSPVLDHTSLILLIERILVAKALGDSEAQQHEGEAYGYHRDDLEDDGDHSVGERFEAGWRAD
jgi:hypothetical protein